MSYEDIAPWIPESGFDCLLTVLNQALMRSGLQPFSRLHIRLELFAFEMFVSYPRFSLVELDTSPVTPLVVRDDPCTLEIKVGSSLIAVRAEASSSLANFVVRKASAWL